MLVLSRFLVVLLFALTACAPLAPLLEEPQVNLSSFRVLPGSGLVPTFEIGLHVVNPNRVPLKLAGLSYAVELEGHRVLNGVANQLPVIEAYGEGDVLLQARPDLVNSINLFAELLSRPRDTFSFQLEADLDVGRFWPKVHVSRSGKISLPPPQ
jgi:LEA14-like dessication related protein